VKEILGDIQKATNTAVMVTEEGTKRTEAGQALARTTGEAIEAIASRIQKVAEAARQISASTRQQLAGMDQVNSAMESIDQAAEPDGSRYPAGGKGGLRTSTNWPKKSRRSLRSINWH
jgi:methyl-accepting chemotaxis protein